MCDATPSDLSDGARQRQATRLEQPRGEREKRTSDANRNRTPRSYDKGLRTPWSGPTFEYLRRSSASECSINRYYDAATGQFISVDPMVESTGNPFAYTSDNPIISTDPLGLCDWANLNPFDSSGCVGDAAGTVASGIADIAVSGWHMAKDLAKFGLQQLNNAEHLINTSATFLSRLPGATFSLIKNHLRLISKIALVVAGIAAAAVCEGTVVCGVIAAGVAMAYYTAGHAGKKSFSIRGLLLAGVEGAVTGAVGAVGGKILSDGEEQINGVLESSVSQLVRHPIQAVKDLVQGGAKAIGGASISGASALASFSFEYADRH